MVEAVLSKGLLLLKIPADLAVDLIDHGALGTVVFVVLVTGATKTQDCGAIASW